VPTAAGGQQLLDSLEASAHAAPALEPRPAAAEATQQADTREIQPLDVAPVRFQPPAAEGPTLGAEAQNERFGRAPVTPGMDLTPPKTVPAATMPPVQARPFGERPDQADLVEGAMGDTIRRGKAEEAAAAAEPATREGYERNLGENSIARGVGQAWSDFGEPVREALLKAGAAATGSQALEDQLAMSEMKRRAIDEVGRTDEGAPLPERIAQGAGDLARVAAGMLPMAVGGEAAPLTEAVLESGAPAAADVAASVAHAAQPIGERALESGVTEGARFGTYEAGKELAGPDRPTAEQLGENVSQATAAGVGFGAAEPFIGAAARATMERARQAWAGAVQQAQIMTAGKSLTSPASPIVRAGSGDPFYTLGLDANASVEDVKSAYRRAVMQYHPDTGAQPDPDAYRLMTKARDAALSDQQAVQARLAPLMEQLRATDDQLRAAKTPAERAAVAKARSAIQRGIQQAGDPLAAYQTEATNMPGVTAPEAAPPRAPSVQEPPAAETPPPVAPAAEAPPAAPQEAAAERPTIDRVERNGNGATVWLSDGSSHIWPDVSPSVAERASEARLAGGDWQSIIGKPTQPIDIPAPPTEPPAEIPAFIQSPATTEPEAAPTPATAPPPVAPGAVPSSGAAAAPFKLEDLLGGGKPLEQAKTEVAGISEEQRGEAQRAGTTALERDESVNRPTLGDDAYPFERGDMRDYQDRILDAMRGGRVRDARALYDEMAAAHEPDDALEHAIQQREEEAKQQPEFFPEAIEHMPREEAALRQPEHQTPAQAMMPLHSLVENRMGELRGLTIEAMAAPDEVGRVSARGGFHESADDAQQMLAEYDKSWGNAYSGQVRDQMKDMRAALEGPQTDAIADPALRAASSRIDTAARLAHTGDTVNARRELERLHLESSRATPGEQTGERGGVLEILRARASVIDHELRESEHGHSNDEIAREQAITDRNDRAVWRATSGGSPKWDVAREYGLSDEELRQHASEAFGVMGGTGGSEKMAGFEHWGGKNPRLSLEQTDGSKIMLKGTKLLNELRRVLGVGQPGETSVAAPTYAPAAPTKGWQAPESPHTINRSGESVPEGLTGRAENVDRWMTVYGEELKNAVRTRPTEYAYGLDKVPGVLTAMRKAFESGNYTVTNGPAIRATAKKFGIKPTQKAIESFFNGETAASPAVKVPPPLSANEQGFASLDMARAQAELARHEEMLDAGLATDEETQQAKKIVKILKARIKQITDHPMTAMGGWSAPAPKPADKGRVVPTRGPNGEVVYRPEAIPSEPASEVGNVRDLPPAVEPGMVAPPKPLPKPATETLPHQLTPQQQAARQEIIRRLAPEPGSDDERMLNDMSAEELAKMAAQEGVVEPSPAEKKVSQRLSNLSAEALDIASGQPRRIARYLEEVAADLERGDIEQADRSLHRAYVDIGEGQTKRAIQVLIADLEKLSTPSVAETEEFNEAPAPGATSKRGVQSVIEEGATRASSADLTKLSDAALNSLIDRSLPKKAQDLRKWAGQVLGRDYASGTWRTDDLYDAVEVALNRWVQNTFGRIDLMKWDGTRIIDYLKAMREVEEKMVPLSPRGSDKLANQQFSTPLPMAAAAQWATDAITQEKLLEPTAGTGNLISMLPAAQNVIVNELDPRRAHLLEELGFHPMTGSALELPLTGLRVNSVVMNPPFGAANTGKYSGFGATPFASNDVAQRFVYAAMESLIPGGRLVAIMGQGTLNPSSTPFRKWLRENYHVRMYLESPEGAYSTRGTDFGTVMVVVDKEPPTDATGGDIAMVTKPSWEQWMDAVARLGGSGDLRRTGGHEPAENVAPVKRTETAPPKEKPRAALVEEETGGTAQAVEPPAAGGVAAGNREASAPAQRGGASGGSERPASGSGGGAATGTGRGADVVAPEGSQAAQPGGKKAVVPGVARGRVEPRTGDSEERRSELEAANDSPVFSAYPLGTAERRRPHPRLVVETRSLGGMPSPPIDAGFKSPLVEAAWGRPGNQGGISDEQADAVLHGLTAWENDHGILVADNVGLGKTREAAALALEAIARDYGPIIYSTKNEVNIDDAMREFRLVSSGKEDGEFPATFVRVSDYKGVKKGTESLPQPKGAAIYFVQATNLEAYAAALAEINPKVWIADEAHLYKNQFAGRGMAWRGLHNQMLEQGGKFAYLTATPGVTLDEYAYLYGLKEWPIGGFSDWVDRKTGHAPPEKPEGEQEAADAAAAAQQGEDAEVGERPTVKAGGAEGQDIEPGKKKKFMRTRPDVFTTRVTPAETEQIVRELKGKGKFISRDLWRGGVVFRVKEIDLLGDSTKSVKDRKRYDTAAELSRDIVRAGRKFGQMNKQTKTMGLDRAMIQSYLKQVLFDLRLDDVLDAAEDALKAGRQPVISVHSVAGDADLEEGMSAADSEVPVNKRLEAAINRINTREVEKEGSGEDAEYIDLGEIPEAVVKKAKLLERARELVPLRDPVRTIEDRFGASKVAAITGRVAQKKRGALMAEFQSGARPVALISPAGKVGISLHDVNGKQRHMLVADYEWSADTFWQELGRVDRAGQKSKPIIELVASNAAGERKFAATIAARMSTLGASSTGSAESSSAADALERFEMGGDISLEAARLAYQQLPGSIKEHFTGSTFVEFRKGGHGAPDMYVPKHSPDGIDIRKFLLEVMMLPTKEAEEVMRLWVANREALTTGERAEASAARRTARAHGEIVRSIKLSEKPPLTMYETVDAAGGKGAMLNGYVTDHMITIQSVRGHEYGEARSRRYGQFTDDKTGAVISGMVLNPAEGSRVASAFGAGATIATAEDAIAALRLGENVPIMGANGEKWILHPRRDDKVQIKGATLSKHQGVLKGYARYEPVGTFLYVPLDDTHLKKLLDRFPPAQGPAKGGEVNEARAVSRGTAPPPVRPRAKRKPLDVPALVDVSPAPEGATPPMHTGEVRTALDKLAKIGSAVQEAFALPTVTPEAGQVADMYREMQGRLARRDELAKKRVKQVRAQLEKLADWQRLMFIDQAESPDTYGGDRPAAAELFDRMRQARIAQVRSLGTGKLEVLVENYMEHIWERGAREAQIGKVVGRRPIEGGKSFTKHRSIPTTLDGIFDGDADRINAFRSAAMAGDGKTAAKMLKEARQSGSRWPVSTNPADLLLLKLHEMDRYILAHKLVAQGKRAGRFVFRSALMPPPKDMKKIEDNIFTVFGSPYVKVSEAVDGMVNEALDDWIARHGVTHEHGPNIGGRAPGFAEGGNLMATRSGSVHGVKMHELGHILDVRYHLMEKLIPPATAHDKLVDAVIDKASGRQSKHGAINRDNAKIKAARDAERQRRVTMRSELRDLADARFQGSEATATQGYKEYVRGRAEQIANAVHALMYAPELMQKIAPTVKAALTKIFQTDPDLRPLLDIKPSLVIETAQYDQAVGGLVVRGHYYAEPEAADTINRSLAPGLQQNALYSAYRGIGNVLNQVQLGLSAFHAMFTTMDVVVSKVALGIEQMMGGDPGKALASWAAAPIAPVANLLRGVKLRNAYLSGGNVDPEMQALVHALVVAGGRVDQHGFYKTGAAAKFWEALRQKHPLSAAAWSAPGLIEWVARPIMERLVPLQKLGVFADLMRYELSRMPDGATDDDARMIAREVWNSVENRLGQMSVNYLFWHPLMRDLGMVTVRSLGWNVGSGKELGGGMADVRHLLNGRTSERPKGPKSAPDEDGFQDEGEAREPLKRPRLTHPLAYTIALPATIAMAGAIYQMLASGKPPESLKDLYFPQDGTLNPDGTPHRRWFASYMRDVIDFQSRPWQTVKNKLHPLLTAIFDVLDNRDFSGRMIHSPREPNEALPHYAGKVAEQEFAHSIKQFKPIGLQYGGDVQSMLGITSAPAEHQGSDAVNMMHDYLSRRGQDTPTPEQGALRDARREIGRRIKAGDQTAQMALDSMVNSGQITRLQYLSTMRGTEEDPRVSSFRQLNFEEAQNVYNVGTPQEKALWQPILEQKEANHAGGGVARPVRPVHPQHLRVGR
jgi:predicted RNA methylase